MLLRILDTEEISDIYNRYMVNDFPKAELKPLAHIINTTKKGLCFSVGMFKGAGEKEEVLLGYAVFILPDGYKYGLLDYLAITGKNRGKGYGHIFFSLVKDFFNIHFPHIKGIFVECESVEGAADTKEKSGRIRRIDFYKDCGCIETRLGSRLFGVEYSILIFNMEADIEGKISDSETWRNALNYIYKKMFKPHHYREQVSLWKRLDRDTYLMSAKRLAPYLIGKLLCRNEDGNIIKYRITETECYCGEEDTACHAHKGKTERTKVLYEIGGTSYVYLCYGIHSLFNVVSGESGHPEAVLIRGVEGFDGPGRLTKAMKIDRSLNGIDMTVSDKLWIEDDGFKCSYRRDRRVGIDYATPKYRDILWRYILVGK